jgi:class 3 adenylate cyclase
MDRVEAHTMKDAVSRAVVLARLLSVAFAVYAFNSLEFIQRFNPAIDLWQNLWPRVLLGSLPLLVLASWTAHSRRSPGFKLVCWALGFSLILHVTAWIHAWPLALTGHGDILVYLQPANVFVVAVVYSVVAPPRRLLLPFSAMLILFFHLPLTWIAADTGNPMLLRVTLGDSAVGLAISLFLSLLVDQLRQQIARLELDKQEHASRFLGPHLAKAIFNNEHELLKRVRCRGFVVSIDIRDSTELQQKQRDLWLSYRAEYFKLVARLAAKHSGHIQKTVGDCHVINFGVMDYGVDLSDIPGIETDLARAEDARLQRASDSVYTFLDELFRQNELLSRRAFAGRPVWLGAGVDKGWVERAVQGDESHLLELDVNGDPVNCSNRLQEYSKVLRNENGWHGSVLVASPFACDYLRNAGAFRRVTMAQPTVRNYAGIRWVLVKVHDESAKDGLAAA